MTVLVCRQSDIQEHWKLTLTALRAVLPESGGHYAIRAVGDFEVQLTIGDATPETTLRYDGQTIPVVSFLETAQGHESSYWLAWHEGWRLPQTGPAGSKKQFRSTSVSIYEGPPGSNKKQVLRAEWAGAELQKVGKSYRAVFQGNGAAHPHWHLSGLSPETEQVSGEPSSGAQLVESSEEVSASLVHDKTALLSDGGALELSLEPAWASIHLATSARWAQNEWLGPDGSQDTHALDPANCAEIRSWLVSCVRYLQSELQGQVQRGRW